MADTSKADSARGSRPAWEAEVRRVQRITPNMVRVVLGGPGLAGFAADEFADHYVKLLFAPPGVAYPEPFDVHRIRAELPRERWPRTRTYTVRRWEPDAGELTLDVVVHGDAGLAAPWAAAAEPGDVVRFLGPGGGCAPAPDAEWHLLVGDESALPAIAVALERLPAGARAHAVIEVAGPEEEQKLDTAADATVTWVHRGERRVGDALLEAVSTLDFPAGAVDAFVHGEAGFVRALRRLLLVDWRVPRERLSISGYWRLHHDEDGWQATKRDYNRRAEAEIDADLGPPPRHQ
ncbi:MAG TPA: siderophore-interacting protein [Micromonosporaceae bacterium]|nr:siderophore-interacting protein [Micromonosporaceae bacterium]